MKKGPLKCREYCIRHAAAGGSENVMKDTLAKF